MPDLRYYDPSNPAERRHGPTPPGWPNDRRKVVTSQEYWESCLDDRTRRDGCLGYFLVLLSVTFMLYVFYLNLYPPDWALEALGRR